MFLIRKKKQNNAKKYRNRKIKELNVSLFNYQRQNEVGMCGRGGGALDLLLKLKS